MGHALAKDEVEPVVIGVDIGGRDVGIVEGT
jgi:hypothetical protein